MPKLNRSLITSIVTDIREFAWVANDMYSWLGRGEIHASWRFPSKSARNVNVMEIVEHHKGTAGEMYILLLELAYDRSLKFSRAQQKYQKVSQQRASLSRIQIFHRIHLVLRLVLEFMDRYPFVEDFFKDTKNVKRPHNLTLATAIHLLWNRLKTMPESLSRNLTRNEGEPSSNMGTMKMSKATQASCSLRSCESCSIAGRTIIELIRGMDLVLRDNELISSASAERELTKLDLFEKTQWSAMSRLMAAINQDARMILDLMRETSMKSEATRSELESRVKRLEAELLLRKVESSALESRNVKTARRLKDVMQELEDVKNERKVARDMNMEMEKSCKIAQTRISLLEECNRILQYQTVAVAECKRSVEKSFKESRQEKENLRALMLVSRNENNTMKIQHNQQVSRLSTALTRLQETRVDEIKESILTSIDQQRKRSVEVSVQTSWARLEFDASTVAGTASIAVAQSEAEVTLLRPEDDPEEDMRQQLMTNEKQIDYLQRQNFRLARTLNRLQKHRRSAHVK